MPHDLVTFGAVPAFIDMRKVCGVRPHQQYSTPYAPLSGSS